MSSVALSRVLYLGSRVCALMRSGVSMDPALQRICEGLPREERAAAQSAAYCAARRAFLCDALIRRLCDQIPQPSVYALLWCALAQLLEEPGRTYAIVSEAVTAARLGRATERAGGFVNACLRSFCRRRESLLPSCLRQAEARCNAPRWWIRSLEAALGPEAASRVFLLQQTKAPLTLRVNRRRTTPGDWCRAAAAAGVQASPLGQDGVMLEKALPVEQIPGFLEGDVSVQDAGAQLAARFLAPKDGEHILDACAAPGGKTAHLLELADADVTALDADEARTRRIRENLRRLGLAARVFAADAGRPRQWGDGTLFDAVLLDAPCTASGIVRRHPDILISRRMSDISSLAQQQRRLLEALWPVVRPGGRMLYSVCSVFPEEGTKQIAAFLERHPDAVPSPLPGLGGETELGLAPEDSPEDRGILPRVHDGFYYALLTKRRP